MIKVSLSSIIDVISGGTPKTKVPEYWNGSIGWLSVTDFNNDLRFVYDTEKKITEKGVKESNTKFLNKGDIIISARGTVGALAQIGEPMCFNQSCFGIRGKQNIADTDFLYYSLKNYVKNIIKRSQGSVFDTINLKSFDLMEIEIPKSISTQKQIAKVLSDLDAKIEINIKINQQLEAMAKTLYDYWFVQFDFPNPSSSSGQAGKPYKSSGGKMVFNEELKREIPEGWEVCKIGDILKTELGGTPSTKVIEYWKGEIPWLNSGEIANFPIIDSQEKVTKEAISNSATSLMLKGSCVLSITRHLRPSILGIDACANQSVVGILESDKLKSSFIYPYLVNEIPRLMKLRTGAQQPHINKKTVDTSLIVNPISDILNDYYKIANPIYDQIINNSFQNQKLSELRDWLLPMLMNGQVSVGGASLRGTKQSYNKSTKNTLGLVAEENEEYN
ncbi:restriction endonuclease subunit S [Polaribacter sp. R77954]|uniref:restriction endonuclease subunit S n=1 Tax=Polaribacter sp. R77954 TaxID=3093870 RepID=UPI0037C6300B